MIKASRTKAILFLLIVPLVLGCYRSPSDDVAINDVRSYFPAVPKLTWVYAGSGNEYAAFTSGVMYAEGDKAQFYQNNGGTRMGLVYEVSAEAVVLVYAREEFYTQAKLLANQPNRRKVLLKAPLKTGQAWESEQERREVMDTAAVVQAPAGSYSNVVKIKITATGTDATWQAYEYYAPKVGLVLREFISGDNRIESRLKAFQNE